MFKKIKVNQHKREKKKIIGCILILVFCFAEPHVLIAQQNETIKELKDKLATSKSDSGGKSILYNKLGEQYKLLGSYDSAIYFFQKAKEIAHKINDGKLLAATINDLANVYQDKKNITKALELYLQALEVAEKTGSFKEISVIYSNMGAIYADQKQYEKGLEYNIKGMAIIEKLKDSIGLAAAYSSIGEKYTQLNSFSKALESFNKSVSICETLITKKKLSGDESSYIYQAKLSSLANISFVLISQKKYKESLEVIDKLLRERQSDISIELKSSILLNKAEAEIGLNEYANAIISAKKAKSLQAIDNMPEQLMYYYADISKAYAGLKDYEQAYQNHLLFKEIADTLISKEKLIAVNEIEAKYETQKKDLQIAQLNSEKKLQRTIAGLSIGAAVIVLGLLLFALRSRRLQKKLFTQKEELLNKEKEIEHKGMEKKMNELEQMALRAQMNPHFIFNSLNSVQHFVLKQDVEGVNKYLGAFAHLIRQTLNNSGKPFITIGEELKYLDTYLLLEKMKSDNKFTYTITVSEEIDRSATFIPGMILQPFVENSIKHGVAYKEDNDGYIHITLSKNDKLVCTIEDNGIGREKAGEIKLASENAGYESKGMAITMNRISYINKIYDTDIIVQVTDRKGNYGNLSGTAVKVEFPLGLE